jgi:glycosyltransferase involved in cell wall biosynthesis
MSPNFTKNIDTMKYCPLKKRARALNASLGKLKVHSIKCFEKRQGFCYFEDYKELAPSLQKEGVKRMLGIVEAKTAPIVSVITIVYNGEAVLEATIQSVLKQDVAHVEYIIIDGGSKDKTVEIIQRYNEHLDYWISEPDQGIYDAMNKGLNAATGEYVWFMNAGDHVHGEQVFSKLFALHPHADVYYGEANFVNEAREVLGTRSEVSTRKLPEALTWTDMIYGMAVCHQSFIARRALVNLYDVQYRCSADIDWVIEVLKKAKTIVNAHAVLSDYLVGGFSMKQQKLAWKERWQIYTKHYGLLKNIGVSIFIVMRYALHRLRGKGNH